MQPVKVNLTVYQGSTFIKVFRWASADLVYRAVVGASLAAPCVITTDEPHELPEGWPYFVVGASNPAGLSQPRKPYAAKVLSPTTLEVPLSTIGMRPLSGNPVVQYNAPRDLSGYTARCHFRRHLTDIDPFVALTTENSGISIDTARHTIALQIAAPATAALQFDSAVYDLEIVSPGGQVSRLAYGTVTLSPEVTRE